MQNRETTPSSDRRDKQEIGSRSPRRVPGLLKLAIFALPVWMALAPYQGFAASLGSRATNANIPLPAGSWTTLNQIRVPANNVKLYCTAVGSADIRMPVGMVGTYLFTLTADVQQPPMNLGQERTVQFVPGDPPIRIKEVTTTQGFTLLPSVDDHFIYWLGRPAVNNPPTVALDRSLTVVCDVDTLEIRNSNPEPLIEDED